MPSSILKQHHDKPVALPAGLFDRIILAISLEKEFKQTRKLLGAFLLLLFISLVAMPFSASFFMRQWQASGAVYFILAATGNLALFFALWQDFMLSILESLPVLAMALFAFNMAALLFSIRLFLYKKGLLIKYIQHSFA